MSDRARLEQALIAADKAGDAGAARTLAQALRSMPKEDQANTVAPTAAPPHDPINDPPLLPGEEGYDGTPSPEPSPFRGLKDYGQRINEAAGAFNRAKPAGVLGGLEALTTLATGGIAAPILGTAESIALGTKPEESFARYTYQPRTESGKAQLGLLGALAGPITDSGTDVALGPLFAAESRAVGAGPAKIPSNARRANPGRGPIPAQPRSMAGAPAPSSASAAPAAQAQRAPGLEGVPQEVAPDLVLEQTTRAAPRTAEEGRARQYVEQRLGLRWEDLGANVRSSLTDVAKDAKALNKLDATAVARQAQLQSFPRPIPATSGQLTRNAVQLRNEGNVAATDAGRPIREIHLDANQAILENLDVLKGRTRGRANTPEEVGLSVQDAALRLKLEKKRAEVREKYKQAEATGELQGKVSPARIVQTVRNSPDKTHFAWVESWLKDMEVIKKTEAGTVTNKLTLKQLEDLRQAAVARAMNGGTDGYYAGKVIAAIDETTEGAGGKLYKEARTARRAQALEFEDQGAVARLVDNKSRTDRAVALEDTWRKTVIGGTLDDIRNVKRSLLTGGDRQTRSAGKQAWRDIRAQTMQFIRDEATKGVALNERGQPNVTPAAMKRAIDKIGTEKMDEIFGYGTARRVDRLLDATRIVKTEPPQIHPGSSTLSNVLSLLERGMSKVPIVGNIGAGTIQAGVKLRQMGQSSRVVRDAQRNALAEAAPKPKSANSILEY